MMYEHYQIDLVSLIKQTEIISINRFDGVRIAKFKWLVCII